MPLASPDLPPPDKALQLACREEKEGGLVLSCYQPRKTTLARVCFSRVKPTRPLALTLQLRTLIVRDKGSRRQAATASIGVDEVCRAVRSRPDAAKAGG